MRQVFYYGLFMDADLLRQQGFTPVVEQLASIDGYGLRIGARATLVAAANERAYGVVMQMHASELARLYAAPDLSDYRGVALTVTGENEERLATISYLLPPERLSGANPEYAHRLAAAARRIGLPAAYIAEIGRWAERR